MGSQIQRWCLIPLLLLFFFSMKTHISFAADTISPGQSLTGSQTLTSAGDNFVLGFFTPGNSSHWYIAIWYKKVSTQTVVWIANRETPLLDRSSSQLKISDDGNLVLLNQSNPLIWSTKINSSTSNSSSFAVLSDSGNLELRTGNSSGPVIWQSIDHPTDTWLPGGKLGKNKRTGENQLLTSWKNSEDPSPGPFSLEIDPDETGQYFILWNRTLRYWSSGVWNGEIFSGVPEMRRNYIYDFSYVDNKDENYFTYSVYNTSIISRFIIDLSGQIKQLSWLDNTQEWNQFWSQPRAQCEVYAFCGPFGVCNENVLPACSCLQGFDPASPVDSNLRDWSGGCVRRTEMQCGNSSSANAKKDGFLQASDMKLPNNSQSLTAGNAKECEVACLNDCSCTAYVYGSGGCSIWIESLLNLQQLSDGSGSDLYIRLAASDVPSSGGKKGTVIGAVVGSVAGAVAVLCIVLCLVWRCRRRRSIGKSDVQGSLIPFTYRELQSVTKNFSEKLGGGGFGSVFKGTLPDKTDLAVKKLEGARQGEKQFRMEVSTIGTIQHVNLIRLRGFCSEGTKRLLVYDFMPKGSLDSHLFHNGSEVLDWRTRFQIALGTARGLAYLHEKCRDTIIHCDIKPENILLDAELCPKVADFGLAKLIGREFSRVLTTMRGTRGYLAPEWISGVAITPKADVYSYGMMLFEVISGKRNVDQSEDGKVGFFPTWAAKQLLEGHVISLLDSKLEGNADLEELDRACRVACWCIQDDESSRPSMGQVVQILEGLLEVNMPPVPRSLQVLLAESQENIKFFSEASSDPHSRPRSTASSSSQTKSSDSVISQ